MTVAAATINESVSFCLWLPGDKGWDRYHPGGRPLAYASILGTLPRSSHRADRLPPQGNEVLCVWHQRTTLDRELAETVLSRNCLRERPFFN
jgi:hypothetical protein